MVSPEATEVLPGETRNNQMRGYYPNGSFCGEHSRGKSHSKGREERKNKSSRDHKQKNLEMAKTKKKAAAAVTLKRSSQQQQLQEKKKRRKGSAKKPQGAEQKDGSEDVPGTTKDLRGEKAHEVTSGCNIGANRGT